MVGYSYSAILGDVLDGYELDLNKEEQVRRFLELDIYEHFHRVRKMCIRDRGMAPPDGYLVFADIF